ncbi:alpha/beta fold hydrolase [Nocardia brevicatena]|uniref:alpha/beta fold hydrolase n=1 Tax=Nocardia brevicatena TaxID=37327 RepID=UPI00031AAE2D|nr:alpha/beta fold hydrolase [Nocardia brevicatena]
MGIADTVTLAARNAWALTFGPGVQSPEPTPATVLWDEPHRRLLRFEPVAVTTQTASPGSPPDSAVLLVPPLAAPASCFDLRPDQSLVRFLLDTGRVPHVIDYGEITFADRRMGFEDWIDDILPEAILRTSADRDGAPVDLVGWSLGGTMSLLTAAAHTELPIRSITAVGAPLDYDKMPGIPQLRAAARFTGGMGVTTAIRAAGGVPARMTRLAYRITAWEREVKRPWFVASNITRTEALARMESIDRFMAEMPGYPGRLYGQLWGRLVLHNDIGRGVVRLGHREIRLSEVTAPVLLVGGPSDVITPAASVRGGTRTLTGAATVHYETAPGSHLGILTGTTARETTWTYLDKFLTTPA